MNIIIAGLGKMGSQLAKKLAEAQTSVIAFDTNEQTLAAVQHANIRPATTKQQAIELAQQATNTVVVWLMIPSEYVSSELKSWLELLPAGSIIIDGGNSDFRKTKEHAAMAATHNVELIDVGTSGGVWGYTNGFSLMAGGSTTAFTHVEPLLKTLSLPRGAYAYFGPSGSGHYVKMVHNAIEYGMMESLAEGYRMLHEGPYEGIDLAKAGDIWQHGSVVASWLNELTQAALQENPTLQGIDGYVAESGEARWTLEVAKDLAIPLPAIQAAFDVRLASQKGETNFATKLLAAMRNKFGGHAQNKS